MGGTDKARPYTEFEPVEGSSPQSGAGKFPIISALIRLYPHKGGISIDGGDVPSGHCSASYHNIRCSSVI